MSPYPSKLAHFTNVSISKWSAVISYETQFNRQILRQSDLSELSGPDHKGGIVMSLN